MNIFKINSPDRTIKKVQQFSSIIKFYLWPLSAGLSGVAQAIPGKSGQQRATHRLTAGPQLVGEESATENYRPELVWGKGENVR